MSMWSSFNYEAKIRETEYDILICPACIGNSIASCGEPTADVNEPMKAIVEILKRERPVAPAPGAVPGPVDPRGGKTRKPKKSRKTKK